MLKSAMTSFSVRRFASEASILAGSRFHKAYQIDYDTIVIRFAVPRSNLDTNPDLKSFLEGGSIPEEEEGISLGTEKGNYVKVDLLFRLGQFIFITSRVRQEMPREASGYAMILRKTLRNRVLESITQLGMDRLLVLKFGLYSGETDGCDLYLELFGDGNIVLVRGAKIEAPFTSRTWSTRVVKRGEDFILPPLSADPHEIDLDMMRSALSGEGDLVRTLIKKASLPPVIAEEVCHRSGLEKDTPLKALGPQDIARVYDELVGLLDELDKGSGCYLYTSDGEPTLLEPVLLKSVFGATKGKDTDRTKRDSVRYPTISIAIEENLFAKGQPPTQQELDLLKAQEKVKRMLESQEGSLNERKEEVELYQTLADSLFLDYGRVDSILKAFDPKAYAADRRAFPDVLKFDPGPDGKGGWVTISIDTSLGAKEVRLDITKDITRNAEEYYDRVKRSRSKIPGIEKAIDDAKDRMEDIRTTVVEPRPSIPLRKFWFEDFRWCFSSEGTLMIGGRDAKSNERLVKKYMRENDRYAHADIKGAPSVIVRVEHEGEPGEPTMEEASHLSVLHSKAWTSKVGSESAFWVTPDQVSRTPGSGEFLPKGSFMIRGKKNLVPKLPLQGAVGLLYVEGVPKVMFGPERAVKANCKGQRFLVVPGRTDKTEVAKAIARELGAEIDKVTSVLPPGDMEMSRIG